MDDDFDRWDDHDDDLDPADEAEMVDDWENNAHDERRIETYARTLDYALEFAIFRLRETPQVETRTPRGCRRVTRARSRRRRRVVSSRGSPGRPGDADADTEPARAGEAAA
jgi:hypothetical protein